MVNRPHRRRSQEEGLEDKEKTHGGLGLRSQAYFFNPNSLAALALSIQTAPAPPGSRASGTVGPGYYPCPPFSYETWEKWGNNDTLITLE
jgi:hypothetical protein